jgi:hypothetical protein
MNHYPCKGNNFMEDAVCYALAHVNVKRHTWTKFTKKYACKKTKDEMTYNKNLCGITYPCDFILKTNANKLSTRVILTSKMVQTFATMKIAIKVVFYVCYLDLTPSMVLMLLIHALHLYEMSYWLSQWWEFKENVAIESRTIWMMIVW